MIVIFSMLTISIDAYAKQGEKNKVKKYSGVQIVCLFGNEDCSKLTNSEKNGLLVQFFNKNQVINPEYYSQLLQKKVPNWEEQKLLATMLVIESHGKTDEVSSEGALGPWQIMPFWKEVLDIPGDIKNPEVNLDYARTILSIYHEKTDGDLWGSKGILAKYSSGAKKYRETRIKTQIKTIEEG